MSGADPQPAAAAAGSAPAAARPGPLGHLSAALVTAAVGFVLGAAALTWRFDQTLYDGALALWSRPVADDLVVVAIDDASLAAIGRWPWPRAVHATLLRKLAADRPRAIGLDLLLSEPDPDPQADAVLAAALRAAAPVVLPAFFYAAPTRGALPLDPVPPLAQAAAAIGHMDTDTDADGVLRQAWLRAGLVQPGADAAALRPHFAVALLQAAGDRVHPAVQTLRAPPAAAAGQQPRWRRDEQLPIRYAGPPGSVRTVSYVSVLRGDLAAGSFAGKLVLIGATAAGLGDAFPTPLSGRGGPMAGVEISAQLIDALRGGHTLRIAPPWAVGLAAALLALLLFVGFRRVGAGRALQFTVAAALLAPVTSALLQGAGLWLAPTPLALTALLAYPLWSWRRLETAHRFLDRELAQWNAVLAAGGGAAAPAPTGARADDLLDAQLAALHSAGAQVRQARQLVAASLAALPEAALVADDAGHVLLANAQAERLLGDGDRTTLAGRPLLDVLASVQPLEAAGWDALAAAAQASGAPRTTTARRGDHVHLLVRLAPLAGHDAPAGALRGLVVSLADVTRLTAAERTRDEMLAFITHDLRSPQASLLSLVELARLGTLPMTPAAVLENVELLVRRTLSTADGFLQINSAETRALAMLPLDLGQTVAEAIAETAPQAQARGIALALPPAGPALPLRGDPELLRRACVNLLNNAIKFSPDGARIDIGLRRHDDRAVLTVRDHGPGISPELQQRLFRKYERAAGLERKPGALQGVGLGLVLVETVARRHGGEVRLESAPGQGACFELRLPLAAAPRADPQAPGAAARP